MAAIRRGNSIYADLTAQSTWDYPSATAPYDYSQNATLSKNQINNVSISKIVFTASSLPATVLITDGGNTAQAVPPAPIINLAIPASAVATSITIDYNPPLVAPNGLIVQSLVNGVVQLTTGVSR
jgi:hypothetical protein